MLFGLACLLVFNMQISLCIDLIFLLSVIQTPVAFCRKKKKKNLIDIVVMIKYFCSEVELYLLGVLNYVLLKYQLWLSHKNSIQEIKIEPAQIHKMEVDIA